MTDKNTGMLELHERWNVFLDRSFKHKTPKARLISLSAHVASAMVSLLFTLRALPMTSLSLGIPLADAFLCSVTSYLPSAYVGALLGTRLSGSPSAARYLTITLIFLLRTAISFFLYGGFKEPIHMRLCYCAVVSFAQCVTYILSHGIHADVAPVLLGTLISAPTLCVIMSFYFAATLKNAVRGSFILKLLHYLSALFVFSCVVYCAKDVRFAGSSLACMLAVFLTLIASKRGGMMIGGVTGALLGYLYLPAYAASIAVTGCVSGLFFFLGALPAAGISAAAGCFIAFKTVGYASLMSFMPECIMALAVASPVIRYSFFTEDFPFILGAKSVASSSASSEDLPRDDGRYGELVRLSNAFRELSRDLGSYSAPSDERTDELCLAICHKFCDKCPVSPICWESERARTSECIKNMISAFRGDVRAERSPKYLAEHCIKFKELTSEIAHSSKSSAPRAKRSVPGSISASEYASFSAILSDLAENERASFTEDAFSEKVFGTAAALGIGRESVTVASGKRKRVYLYETERELAEHFCAGISKSTGIKFKLTRPAELQNGPYLLLPSERLTARTAFSKLTKPGEIYSGDAAFAFPDSSGRFFAILTDGMGSGSEAAECSEIASALLKKLLLCNVRKSLAAEMLGNVLRKRGNECFCTVDILEADLVNGNASFLKSGAAASYILRHGSVHCVSAYSMPLGITDKATPEEVSFTLSPGDIAVMVSDGVAAEPSDGNIFTDILTAGAFSDIKELADRILTRAVERNGRTDDMTVMVIEIDEAEEETEQKLG